MKNKRIENLLKSARKYATAALGRNEYSHDKKIVIYHKYRDSNGNLYRDKGYWDDVAFKHGKYYVVVCWTHPRYEYGDMANSLAYDIVEAKYGNLLPSFLTSPGKTNYKRVGNSRKKATSYITSNIGMPTGYYEFWKSTEKELAKTGTHVAKCHFNVSISDYCRRVSICYPIEVIDENSLSDLSKYVKECLNHPGLFESNWNSYVYSKENWNEENPISN